MKSHRGFTLVEVAVVIAIIAVVATLAYTSLERYRPRANAANAATELQSLLHGARQQALATGHDVLVLVFPDYATGPSSQGRVVVYEDGNFDFFSDAAAVSFAKFDPSKSVTGDRSQILSTLDLPLGVAVGPASGLGGGTKLVAPYAGVDVTKACAFCAAGGDRRGAIRFDARGQASFYSANGAPVDAPSGSSFTVTSTDVGGTTTFVVASGTGSVLAVNKG